MPNRLDIEIRDTIIKLIVWRSIYINFEKLKSKENCEYVWNPFNIVLRRKKEVHWRYSLGGIICFRLKAHVKYTLEHDWIQARSLLVSTLL